MSNEKTDIPDIPPEKLGRKPLPLTAETADLLGEKQYMAEGGVTVDIGARSRRPDPAAIAAAERAEKYAGPEPVRGLTTQQIEAIKGLALPDMPPMDPLLGDRTEAYRNALWARAPWYAAVRYAYRLKTWPTKLPAVWPPRRPDNWLTSLASVSVQPAADPAAAAEQVMVIDGDKIRAARPDDVLVVEPGKPPRVATPEELRARLEKQKPRAPRKRAAAPKSPSTETSSS